jgi:hypothetical protein
VRKVVAEKGFFVLALLLHLRVVNCKLHPSAKY